MKFFKCIALLLCALLVSALTGLTAAAANSPDTPLRRYASELTQYTGLKYYRNENTQRYIDYKISHPANSWENVLTCVNIGLDRSFYTKPVVVANPGAVNVLVNKYRSLPQNYVPSRLEIVSAACSTGTVKLTHNARAAFEKMCADARKLGYNIYALSGYRSYSSQKALYSSYTSAETRERLVARPGFSEHQTGLAVDIRSDTALTNSAVFKWYAKNACKYGFIIRYPDGAESILGYKNEPWHLRYLGTALATAVYKSGLTYDEYYARELDVPAKSAAAMAVGVSSQLNITAGGSTFQLSTYDVLGDTYFKLRDIAAVLNGTDMQFDVTWDAETLQIGLQPGAAYSGDTALAAFAPECAAPVTAVTAVLQANCALYDTAAYSRDGSTYCRLDGLLQILGLTAADDGQGGLILIPNVTPSSASYAPSDERPVPNAPAA